VTVLLVFVEANRGVVGVSKVFFGLRKEGEVRPGQDSRWNVNVRRGVTKTQHTISFAIGAGPTY